MKLKICGLQTLQDINYVNKAEVDFAGFVFTPHRQQITLKTAQKLKSALNPKIKSVGVFVGESYEFIKNIVDQKIVDIVQFHGEQEYALPCPTIKAFKMRTKLDIKPTSCNFALFDSFQENTPGSSGKTFDWRLIENYADKPFFLAGGINITNVRKALKLNPYCIDISSGAEEHGEKSFEKIMALSYLCKAWRN